MHLEVSICVARGVPKSDIVTKILKVGKRSDIRLIISKLRLRAYTILINKASILLILDKITRKKLYFKNLFLTITKYMMKQSIIF